MAVTVLGLIALLFMLFISPENPKWLLIKGRKEEAISAFNKIAVINGSNFRIESDAIFIEFEETLKEVTAIAELSRLMEKEND